MPRRSPPPHGREEWRARLEANRYVPMTNDIDHARTAPLVDDTIGDCAPDRPTIAERIVAAAAALVTAALVGGIVKGWW